MSVLDAKLKFSFLCDYASVSRDGKLSMNGIFENINSRVFPTRHPLMFVVANISGLNNKDKFTCELANKDAADKKLAVISQEVTVDPRRNFGFIGQFVNIAYEAPGEYVIRFFIDNKELGAHYFQVRSMAQGT
ncbi:MAG: hypothetical protein KJ893_07100 [Candidatus Omnitrophica bacterium]|nr:hypothetical protein [Candidatus Omnitrophota bacterium]MBU4477896.1 hypothetical protein [Candidatus Omnitrophota bacterium]MCG2704208.1 hypothetical protein [Candidatus Omnitrophota bacterium]